MPTKTFRTIKSEIRVLGIDDGHFVPHKPSNVLVVGVVFKGGLWFEGIMHTSVELDGFDATEKIASMIRRSVHFKQLRLVMLNGITFAGFNIVNIKLLNLETNLPIIAVMRDMPDLHAMKNALHNLTQFEKRWQAIQEAGNILKITSYKGKKIFVELAGISEIDAQKIIDLTATRSSLPEPLRIAHLIASGLTV